MDRTVISVTLFLIALFITWLIDRVFKLKLTTSMFGLITIALWFGLNMAWILCPGVRQIYGPG